MIRYVERSLIPPERFTDTFKKVITLFSKSQIPILEYDGSDLDSTLNELAVNLTLFDCSAITLRYKDKTKPGHMVCIVRQMGSTGEYFEYFDSEGTPLDEYGSPEDPTAADGIGNPNAIVTGLIDRGKYVEYYRPPQQYLRTANGLQIPHHKTCSLQTLFRLMNKNLPAKDYYAMLFHQAGTIYDAYMIQSIEDMFNAKNKILRGESSQISWLGDVIPYEDLRKAYVSRDEIREIRFKEAESRGQQWLAGQLEADDLGAIDYAKWTQDQADLSLMLFNEELYDGKELDQAIARADRAKKVAEEAADSLSRLGYTDVEQIMEDLEAERHGETITPPDVEEFTPEEQERIRQRADELRALVRSADSEPDSAELFRRRLAELRQIVS